MATSRLSKCIFNELKLRNAVQQTTSPFLYKRLETPTTSYFGVDPTSDAVHIGNLLPIITSFRLLLAGNPIIALVGSSTASIGDPSERLEERKTLASDVLESNERGIHSGLNYLFNNIQTYAQKKLNRQIEAPLKILNNKEWAESLKLVSFLRDYGKAFRISAMLNKESVSSRLSSEKGMGLGEFMYQALQAYDYYHLYNNHQCQLQVGGSDQWGNIVAGMDLISRTSSFDSPPCYGLTLPLLMSPSGKKYSKSSGKALWLNPDKTSVYDFYQFLKTLPDNEVEKYLLYFTFYTVPEIEEIMEEHSKDPSKRYGQTYLADALTEIIHGETALRRAQRKTEILFSPNQSKFLEMDANEIFECFSDYPRFSKIEFSPTTPPHIADLCVMSGAAPSNNQVTKITKVRGLDFNGREIKQAFEKIAVGTLHCGKFAILSVYKTSFWILHCAPVEEPKVEKEQDESTLAETT